ncbi:MAG: hypothetical protein KDK78_05905 [Chlamydiia bacterium]|nr:hypothetical protein [Chlamydiia bacterium]
MSVPQIRSTKSFDKSEFQNRVNAEATEHNGRFWIVRKFKEMTSSLVEALLRNNAFTPKMETLFNHVFKPAQERQDKKIDAGSFVQFDGLRPLTLQAKLPKSCSVSTINKQRDEILATKMSKKELAYAHVAQTQGDKLEDLQSLDGSKWTALRIERDSNGRYNVTEKKVRGTSERSLGLSDDLYNVYANITSDGLISISCSVIDSEAKADNFIAAVQWALKEREKRFPGREFPPLRINMHQINSMGFDVLGKNLGGEEGKILNQRQAAYYIERELKKLGLGSPSERILSHKNVAYNGMTHKYFVKGEESKNHAINSEPLAIQMEWALHDCGLGGSDLAKNIHSLLEKQRVIRDTLVETEEELLRNSTDPELLSLTKQLKTKQFELKSLRSNMAHVDKDNICQFEKLEKQALALVKSINKLEKKQTKLLKKLSRKTSRPLTGQLKENREALHVLMKEFAHADLKAADSKKQSILACAQLLAKIQTGDPSTKGYSQAQVIALDILLDRMLGVATEINCASGLDRTGDIRSMLKAMDCEIRRQTTKFLKDGFAPATARTKALEEMFEFMCTFHTTRKAMDKQWLFAKKQDPTLKFSDWIREERKEFQAVHNFQVLRFAELMGVGREITERSCGVAGFKWHHIKKLKRKIYNPLTWLSRASENPHPPGWMPIEVWDSEKQEYITLIEVKKKRRSMTREGRILMEGLSQARGT